MADGAPPQSKATFKLDCLRKFKLFRFSAIIFIARKENVERSISPFTRASSRRISRRENIRVASRTAFLTLGLSWCANRHAYPINLLVPNRAKVSFSFRRLRSRKSGPHVNEVSKTLRKEETATLIASASHFLSTLLFLQAAMRCFFASSVPSSASLISGQSSQTRKFEKISEYSSMHNFSSSSRKKGIFCTSSSLIAFARDVRPLDGVLDLDGWW